MESLLEEALLRGLAVCTSGRYANIHSAGPLCPHKAPACVDGDVVGGGFAAANHMAVDIKRALCRQ